MSFIILAGGLSNELVESFANPFFYQDQRQVNT